MAEHATAPPETVRYGLYTNLTQNFHFLSRQKLSSEFCNPQQVQHRNSQAEDRQLFFHPGKNARSSPRNKPEAALPQDVQRGGVL